MKKLLYLLLAIIILTLCYLAYINKVFTSVKTYDDCVAAGGIVHTTMTPHCTRYGLNYSGLTAKDFPNFGPTRPSTILPMPNAATSDLVQAFILSLSVGNSIEGTTYKIDINGNILDYSEHPHLQKEPLNSIRRTLSSSELGQIQASIRATKLFTMTSTQEIVPDAGMYRLAVTQEGTSKQLACFMPLPDRPDSACTRSMFAVADTIDRILNLDK